MGQAASYNLTQYDVEALIDYCDGVYNQAEVEALYNRFRALDRGRKGFIGSDEFVNIPEISINPIAARLVMMFENVNFKEFCKLLAPFSKQAIPEQKLDCMFRVWDVDGDGIVSQEDMQIMLRQLAGSTLSEDDLAALVSKALAEANSPNGLDLKGFRAALQDTDMSKMVVEVPMH